MKQKRRQLSAHRVATTFQVHESMYGFLHSLWKVYIYLCKTLPAFYKLILVGEASIEIYVILYDFTTATHQRLSIRLAKQVVIFKLMLEF